MVTLNLIIAGRDCAEVDYVGSTIMGYTLDEIKHLRYYIELNNIKVDGIEVVGEKVADVKHSFKKVKMEKIIPKKFKIHNKDACSSCMNALLLSCRFLEREITKNIDIYLGSKVDKEDITDGFKIAFGNCCNKNNKNIKFDINVRGCPPYPFDLKNNLEKDEL